MSNFSSKFSFTLLFALLSVIGWGQVNMTTSGSINQDFNTLSNNTVATTWTDNSTITSWYSQRTGSGTTYQSGSGSSTTGNLYSFCLNTSATDKAIGSIGSGNATAGSFAHGVLLRNTSGAAITNLTVAYTGEQWRRENVAAQTITFWYRTSSSTISALNPNVNTGWTAVTALNFTSPQFSAAATALDGNLAANRTVISAVAIPSLSLANNDYIMLRWSDPDHTGSDHGLGIDDVTVSWTTSASSFSGVTAGAGSEPATVSSLTTALTGAVSPQTNAILNFDFTVTDDANTTSGNDALPTLINNIVIPQGTGNDVANWTQAIAGAQLSDGTNTLTGTVNTTNLTFSSINTATLGNIADNATKTYSLRIWLNTSLGGTLPTTIDGLNLAFKIDRTNFTTASSATSTQFESGAGTVVESGSTNNAVDVVATKLNFVVQPTNVNQNATMAPSVTISANDPNNNRDLNYTTAVSVSSTGTMTGSPLSAPTTAGLATVGAVVHTVAGSGLFLTGTSGSLTATGNSSAFNVVALNPVINVTGQAHNSTYAFGNVAWGSTLDQTFTINNTGTAIMNISSLTFGGSGFAIQGAAPTTVAIGGSANFTVRFTPNAIGAFTGSVTINNNSSNQTAYVINFTGTGTPSNLSTIIEDGAYSYTSNHAYLSLQAAGPLTSTSNSAGVFRFQVRDGGGTTDSDGLGTELNSITFSVGTTHINYIRTAALFDANTMRANTPTINIGAGTITFSGLSGVNFTAIDGGILTLTLRVSYLTTVLDNAQIQYTISAATANAAGSVFASPNAGGAASSITGDRNRIEVIADRLAFVQQPSTVSTGANMAPAPSVAAVDANGNRDLDFAGTLTMSSTGTPSSQPSASASNGLSTFSSVNHSAAATGRTLTVNSTGLAFSNTTTSNSFDIIDIPIGSYKTTTSGVWSSSAGNNTITWQELTGSGWVTMTSPSYPNTNTTNNVYVFDTVTLNGTNSAKNIIVESTGILSTSTVTPTFKNLLIKDGGIFNKNPGNGLKFDSDGILEVEDGGTFNYSHTNTTSRSTNLWNGTEKFHPNSNFVVKETDNGTGNLVIQDTSDVSSFNGAKFGNFIVDMGAAGGQVPLFVSGLNTKLTHGDFILRTGSDNGMIFNSGTYTVTIGGDLIVESTYTQPFTLTNSASTVNFTVNGNVVHNGSAEFRLANSQTTNNPSVTFNIDGNLTLGTSNFNFDIGSSSTGSSKSTLNLKGNLLTGTGNILTTNTNTAKRGDFNFTGTTTQTVDVASTGATTENARLNFNIKSGAIVQLITRNLELGTNSKVNVEGDGTFDFGFNGTTPLLVAISGSQTGTTFESLQGSTLKITSPDGITTTSGTGAGIGNVQVPASNRSYNQVATFWYIGKANQVTGNGITTGSSGKIIICDLIDNNTQLSFTNSTGITNNTSASTTGGKLDIRKGQVIESTTAFISGSTGTLYMEPGTLYQIAKGSSSATDAYNDLIPRVVGGTFPYVLNGGTIELTGNGSSDAFQVLRGSQSRPNFIHVKFSGANTLGTDYKALSTATVIDSSLILTGSTVVDCVNSTNQAASFTGAGALVMDGGRLRIKKLNDANPELNGTAVDYAVTGGTIEFYGSGATQTQRLRGTDGNSSTISYHNIEVNALATNLNFGSSLGNLTPSASFAITGTMNVNKPASLRLDATNNISGTGNFVVNDSATLFYASPNGIKTSGTGTSDGHIRISSTRSFSSNASYGFVGNQAMVSGNALPNQVINLYAAKTAGIDIELSNSVEVKNNLEFVGGVLQTTGTNEVYVSNLSTSAIIGGATSGTDKYVEGRLRRATDGSSTYSFPIGHSAQNAQGFSITPTGTSGSNILGFLEANSSSPLQARAYCDLETKTASGQQIGQGTAGADGALDLVTFNLASPLQWDVTNPGGGITAYNITVNANGGQDINPVSAAGGTPIRYLMKNGEPGNTGVTTGTGGADYPSTGFLACPNGYTLTGMTSFSDFTLDGASQSNTGLPVKLTYFTARKEGETSVLNWMTSLEIDNDRFEVERKVNEDFEYIGKVNGSGNSTSPIRYQFVDEAPANAWNYYRLKQVDFDGKFDYSNIVALYFDNKEEVSVSFYPNPVDNNIFISVNNKNVIQEAAIYNALGQEIRKIDIDSNNDVSDLASGTYLIKVQTGLQIITKQFVKF